MTFGGITDCIVIYVFIYLIISTTCFGEILRSYDNITRKKITIVQNPKSITESDLFDDIIFKPCEYLIDQFIYIPKVKPINVKRI